MSNNQQLYRELTLKINKTLNRKAVTPDQLVALIEKAKIVSNTKGTLGLIAFASKIPDHFFTQAEIEKLQASPLWSEFSKKMIGVFVQEGIITKMQATLLKSSL